MFFNQVKNIFASRTQNLLLKSMFPSLATQGNISGNNVSATTQCPKIVSEIDPKSFGAFEKRTPGSGLQGFTRSLDKIHSTV